MNHVRIAMLVHYVSEGSKNGRYPSTCRAAIVTQVHSQTEVGVVVHNPTGCFYHEDLPYGEMEPAPSGEFPTGTWHKLEDCPR